MFVLLCINASEPPDDVMLPEHDNIGQWRQMLDESSLVMPVSFQQGQRRRDVHSEAGCSVPVAPVAADIVVCEHGLEVVGALPPINPAVKDEVAGHILATSVGHESCTTRSIACHSNALATSSLSLPSTGSSL